jgi:hypothetical protein
VVQAVDQMPAAALLLLGGVVVCFWGRKLFRTSLAIVGFVVGASAASSVFGLSDRMPMLIAGIVGGLIGAFILYTAYYVGVALVGAAFGAVAANLAFSLMDREPPVFAIVLCAAGGAVLATYLQRYFVIVGSGVVGALMMVHGAIGLAGRQFGVSPSSSGVWVVVPFDPAPGQRWVPIAWGVLALVGIAVQLGWTGGEKGRVGGRGKPKAAQA